jgi:hypothetical protein
MNIRILSALVLALIGISRAHAQETRAQATSSLMALGMPAQLATEVAGLSTGLGIVTSSLRFGATGPIIAPTALAFAVGAATTPNASLSTSGLTFVNNGMDIVYPAAAVITPSTGVPTPAAGNTLTNRYTILAAGAPTAAFVVLPVATSSVGKTFTVFNQGSNPLAIVPQTGVVNVSAALTPFSCTTLKECQCKGLTTAAFGCSQQ